MVRHAARGAGSYCTEGCPWPIDHPAVRPSDPSSVRPSGRSSDRSSVGPSLRPIDRPPVRSILRPTDRCDRRSRITFPHSGIWTDRPTGHQHVFSRTTGSILQVSWEYSSPNFHGRGRAHGNLLKIPRFSKAAGNIPYPNFHGRGSAHGILLKSLRFADQFLPPKSQNAAQK